MLKKDTNYRWNRGFLLFGGLCSLILPLANIAYPFSNAGSDNISLSYYLNPIVLNSNSGVSASDYDYISIIFYGYLIIGAALLLKFFAGLFNLTLLITKSKIVSKEGKKYYLIEKEVSPFSFFKMIFLPNDEIDNSLLDRIIKHEQIHAKKNHSVDVLFFELIKIILWFNPFAWLYRKEVEAQNEFAADDEMLQNGYDISEYKHEIFDFSLLQSNSLTNNFNSLLKRRLKMLTSKKSSGLSKSKFLLTIPLLFLLIFAFNNPNNAKNIITGKSADSVYTTADQMPEYPGGQSQMYNFILKNLGYPMIAKKAGIQGKVFVEFVVNKNGKIQNAKVKTGIGGGCDEEALRVVKAMPKWIPGKHNGKNVAVKITLPIMFKLQ
ncbi:MAG: M56 family metallopeptidase [Bacteroidota bacterium]|nr:M56 family metallopeptidase [Bacteroidota bacterium]